MSTETARELLDTLAAEVEAIASGEDWTAWLKQASRFHTYSFGNQLLIAFQRPDATKVAGYRAWQGLNRQVRRGEKGIAILAPMVGKRTAADGTETHALYGFRTVSVFDVAQTDGEPLAEPIRPELLAGTVPEGSWSLVTSLVAEQGYTVAFEDCGPAWGMTSPKSKTVSIRPGMSDAQNLQTLGHELGHILAGHCDDSYSYVDCRGVAETEAESIAFLIMNAFGIDSGRFAFPYVAGWSGGKRATVQATAERVLKAMRPFYAAVESRELSSC